MTNLIALKSGTELVGDFRIDRVLGAGGFGITYLAKEIADFDPSAGNMVYTFTTKGSGTADTFGANVTISVDGAAPISAVANGTGANTALQISNATFVVSGNIPANSTVISGNITPAAHGTDAMLIFGLRVQYKKKLN